MASVLSPIESEAQLLQRLRLRDAAAFESLVRASAGRMLAVAQRFLKSDSDAQDAVQEAFVQAFKAIPEFKGRCTLSTWLHSITVRCCLMRMRKLKSRNETSIEPLLPQFKWDGHRKDPDPRWSDSETTAASAEERQLIRKCIDQLPDDYRNIILLRDIQEMDTRDVAEYLEISESLVKTRLHRARQALRTLLAPHFQEA
jgi:RNA polymerase sigma-70 factor (ECF subfamily)